MSRSPFPSGLHNELPSFSRSQPCCRHCRPHEAVGAPLTWTRRARPLELCFDFFFILFLFTPAWTAVVSQTSKSQRQCPGFASCGTCSSCPSCTMGISRQRLVRKPASNWSSGLTRRGCSTYLQFCNNLTCYAPFLCLLQDMVPC